MRKLILSVFLLFSLFSFSSCETLATAVLDTIFGYDTCSYPACNRRAENNSIYCSIHGHREVEVPADLGKNINQSIRKQMEEYKESEKRMKTKSSD